MENFKIKVAIESDLENLIKFLKKPEIDELFVSPLSQRKISIEKRVYSKYNEGLWLIITDENNEIIGCRALVPEFNSVMLSTFAINPSYQGKKLGKKLYQASINIAKERFNCKEIFVDSWNSNKTASILAKKFGFEKYKEFDDPDKRPKGIKTVIYRLEIE